MVFFLVVLYVIKVDVVEVFDLFKIGYGYIVCVGIYIWNDYIVFFMQDFICVCGDRVICGFDDQGCFDVICIREVDDFFYCCRDQDVVVFFYDCCIVFGVVCIREVFYVVMFDDLVVDIFDVQFVRIGQGIVVFDNVDDFIVIFFVEEFCGVIVYVIQILYNDVFVIQ